MMDKINKATDETKKMTGERQYSEKTFPRGNSYHLPSTTAIS
jgi:hypothetical protein